MAQEKLSDSEVQAQHRQEARRHKAGKQFSTQPRDIAKKAASARTPGKSTSKSASSTTKAELMARARKQGIEGRSRMSKAELERALR
jgi:hypothetical protein